MSWLRNPFRKATPPAPRPAEPLRDDWKPGDLAVCMCACWAIPGPPQGQLCRVTHVGHARATHGASPGDHFFMLCVEGYPHGYEANLFRKVTPDFDAADMRFAASIKALGRVKEPAQ